MYCPNPFTHLDVKVNGDVYCCCEGWLPRPLGNVLRGDNILDIWRGGTIREIRDSILDGSFKYCELCPYLPEPTGSWPIVAETPTLPSPDVVHILKLDYDQSCNLTCPSCRIAHSREFADLNKAKLIHEAVIGSGILAHTKRLYVTGFGDPFASSLYSNFLKTLDSHVLHPDMDVFLHTNALLLDEAHWKELGHATRSRVAEIGISVDAATEATYHTIRGGSWTKLWKNIEFINEIQSSSVGPNGKPIMLGLFYVVQAANFREIESFLQLAWNHRVSWISLSALHNWGTYTNADYCSRAVHLPDHPDHEEFARTITKIRSLKDYRINIETFKPEHSNQYVVTAPGALLPASLRHPRTIRS
jgi:hypothetical protein